MAITTAQGYVNQIEREGERISDPPALYVQTVRGSSLRMVPTILLTS